MDDVLALSVPEQFALWSLRYRRACPWDADTLAEGFLRAFGLAAVEAGLAAFGQLCAPLSRHPRRRLSFNGCRCRVVAPDERCLLTLLAAVQAGDRPHAEALALWLCRPPGQGDLTQGAADLAAVFQRRGMLLPAPTQADRGRRSPARLGRTG